MSRIDNKFVVEGPTLRALVPDLAQTFDILDIEKQRSFTYATRYFDDDAKSAYFEHHQGVRKGFKVRVRRYVDAGLCFLEVKVKGQRGMTEKYRMPYDPETLDALTREATDFAQTTYSTQYEKPFDYALVPSLDVQYRRITLVAREGGERMTIDTDLKFSANGRNLETGSDLFIVETKSANGRGVADVLLRSAKVRPAKRCSKYCVGMAAMGQVSRYNHFLPTMRQLGLAPSWQPLGLWSETPSDLFAHLHGPSSISNSAAA
ncbi:polyphosphate polymerase domain-containing protein [Octadecabacter sp. R77987]|uniref:polyphosphate polymerase domain-containing protein n=1 Tax=Octadecabacter sp. R77987 TaxID=3093874 RepID=UPI0036715B13